MDQYEIQLDAYVLPDGHSVWKLFPGKTYALNEQIFQKGMAILDIRGIDRLPQNVFDWDDGELVEILVEDRQWRASMEKKPIKRPTQYVNKRITFFNNLFRNAKQGDLVVVPLGRGLDGEVAVGEFVDEPGVLRRVSAMDAYGAFETLGRKVNWKFRGARRRFSMELNSSLHAPTAAHLMPSQFREEVYLAAYGSFTYDDIYVAVFPSAKERLTTTDQVGIGLWFNGMAVIHDFGLAGQQAPSNDDFVELGLFDSSAAELELMRNSPWSAVVRTIGPLAFSMAAIYPMAAAATPKEALETVKVSAHTVGAATDKCAVNVPQDMRVVAKAMGFDHWQKACRRAATTHDKATVKSKSTLKSRPRSPNKRK